MASAKQIAWRKKFVKLYGKKKKGGKSSKLNPKVQKAFEDLKSKGLTSKPKKLSKAYERKYKPNSPNDDGYYITKEGSLFVLRQKRFKDRLDRGKKEHPHDVMAYGRTRAEISCSKGIFVCKKQY